MKKITVLVLALVLALGLTLPTLALADNYNPPIVEIAGGKLAGFQDGSTYCFRGIQYATAERFQQPQPVLAWEGVKNAQTYGAVCPIIPGTPWKTEQVNRDEFVWPHRYWIQDEECMNLNVWTQSLDKNAKKPVMVFFHGGGFNNGSSIEAYAYDGKNLSEYGDVVTVTVNHRLNVLGCLDLSAYGEEYKNSANIAMSDLVAALKWVNENIESFGGDPERVMIYGQSGGSTKTVLMYCIPEAEGLFSCGAGQSSGGASAMEPGDSARAAEIILENLGLDGTKIDELKKVPYAQLIDVATKALEQVSEETGRSVRWRPTKDGEYILSDWADFAKDIPLIIGSVFSENFGTLHMGTGKNEWTDEEAEAKLTEKFGEDKDAIVAEFKKLFPDKKVQDVLYYNNRTTVRNNVIARDSKVDAPVYNYLFSLEFPINGGITAFHCSELTYVFHNVGMPECTLATGGAEESYALQDKMAKAWINFVSTGNPSTEELEWKPWTEAEQGALVFDADTRYQSLDDRLLCELLAKHA
ncbi:MAG: carboxylesterase family protein [Clostridia bacterium]